MVSGKNVDLEPRHSGSVKCSKTHIYKVTSIVTWVGLRAGARQWKPSSGILILILLCDLGQVNKPLRVLVLWRIGTVTHPQPPSQGNQVFRDFTGLHRGGDT